MKQQCKEFLTGRPESIFFPPGIDTEETQDAQNVVYSTVRTTLWWTVKLPGRSRTANTM